MNLFILIMGKLRTKFGKRLRTLRKERVLTQQKLAEAVGVSVEFLSNVERGVNAPSFDTLEKLSKALSVPENELFIFNEEDDYIK